MRVGEKIGRKVVLAEWKRGPFTYVLVECTCGSKAQATYALGMMKRGQGWTCRSCMKQPLDKALGKD